MKININQILIGFALLCIGYIIGFAMTYKETKNVPIETRTDYIQVHDTVLFPDPSYIEVLRYDTAFLSVVKYDSILVLDSVKVEIPIEQVTYQDTLPDSASYMLKISGYRPQLDSLLINYPQQQINLLQGDKKGKKILYGTIGIGVGLLVGLLTSYAA